MDALHIQRFGIVLSVAAIGWPSLATGAESIATVTRIQGAVSIVEATTRTPRVLTVAPDTGRVANGGIQNGDEIKTVSGASATIEFPDKSIIQLGGAARLGLVESSIASGSAAQSKKVKRQLRLHEGRMECTVTSGTAIYTSVRTPAGIVGIKGTQFTVATIGNRCQVAVTSGQAFLMDAQGRAILDLGQGAQALLELTESNDLLIQILAAGPEGIATTIGNARLRMQEGAVVRVSGEAGIRVTLTGVSGTCQVTNTATGKVESLSPNKTLYVLGGPPEVSSADAEKVARPAGVEIPFLPAIPRVQDTVESSPFKKR
jgi:hypothetical protein